MKNLTKKQLAQIEKHIKKTLDDFNYQHVKHVLYFAKKLAKNKKVNWPLIYTAILFHDIAKTNNFNLLKHAQPGAKAAKKFLTKIKTNKNFTNQVYQLVLTHSNPWSKEGKVLKTAEAKILYDADMIAHLNSYGIATHFYYLNAKTFRKTFANTKQGLTTAFQTIQTKSGKKLAQPYYQKVKFFLTELEKNLKGRI